MNYVTFPEIVRLAKKNCQSVRLLRTIDCTYYAILYGSNFSIRTRAYISRDFVSNCLRKHGLVEMEDCVTFAPLFG